MVSTRITNDLRVKLHGPKGPTLLLVIIRDNYKRCIALCFGITFSVYKFPRKFIRLLEIDQESILILESQTIIYCVVCVIRRDFFLISDRPSRSTPSNESKGPDEFFFTQIYSFTGPSRLVKGLGSAVHEMVTLTSRGWLIYTLPSLETSRSRTQLGFLDDEE